MESIIQTLRASAALILRLQDQTEIIGAMIDCIWEKMEHGGKLLLCGNGGSAADAQHLAAECMVRLQEPRRPLPAIALTADTSLLTAAGNDDGFETVFARQVAGLGRAGDVLLVLSTSGNSPNIVRAVEKAHHRGVQTLGLLGKGGGAVRPKLDQALVVPSENTQRIQEAHILVGHVICEALERRLLACTAGGATASKAVV